MAADYILDKQMEEIEEQNKDFIAQKAAIYVANGDFSRENAIKHVEDVLVERQESQHDIAVCIRGDGEQDDQWLTEYTRLPSLPTDIAKKQQIFVIEKEIRKMLD